MDKEILQTYHEGGEKKEKKNLNKNQILYYQCGESHWYVAM